MSCWAGSPRPECTTPRRSPKPPAGESAAPTSSGRLGDCSSSLPITPPAASSPWDDRDAMATGPPPGAALPRPLAPRRRRRARHRRHPRRPAAARRPRRQGRHRVDEPRWARRAPPSNWTTASPATAPQDIERLGFDAGKLLLRIDYEDPGRSHPGVRAARRRRDGGARPAGVRRAVPQPPPPRRRAPQRPERRGRHQVHRHRIGPGRTSAYTWLKVPVTEDIRRQGSRWRSTLPAVLLGGEVPARTRRRVREVARRAATPHRAGPGRRPGRALPGRRRRDAAVDTAVGLL